MADRKVQLLGLTFPHPVIPGAGPNVENAAAIGHALDGGAAAALTHTMALSPPPSTRTSPCVPFTTTGLFHQSSGSSLPFERWIAEELPQALARARALGVPFVASVTGAADDLVALGTQLESSGVDALEVSTHHMEREQIRPALERLRQCVGIPVIVKLSARHGEDMADLAAELEPHTDAFTVMDSFGPTLLFDAEAAAPFLGTRYGIGYVSGAPVRPIAQRFVFEVARRVQKPVIASGGVQSGQDVIEYLMLGASLVQVCTRAILRGPQVYGQIAQEVGEWLDRHGYRSLEDVRGAYLRKYGHGQYVITEKQEAPQLEEAACIKCHQCEVVCFYDAIKAPPKVLPTITESNCFQCGLCVSVCPTDALFFRPRDEVTLIPKAV